MYNEIFFNNIIMVFCVSKEKIVEIFIYVFLYIIVFSTITLIFNIILFNHIQS